MLIVLGRKGVDLLSMRVRYVVLQVVGRNGVAFGVEEDVSAGLLGRHVARRALGLEVDDLRDFRCFSGEVCPVSVTVRIA